MLRYCLTFMGASLFCASQSDKTFCDRKQFFDLVAADTEAKLRESRAGGINVDRLALAIAQKNLFNLSDFFLNPHTQQQYNAFGKSYKKCTDPMLLNQFLAQDLLWPLQPIDQEVVRCSISKIVAMKICCSDYLAQCTSLLTFVDVTLDDECFVLHFPTLGDVVRRNTCLVDDGDEIEDDHHTSSLFAKTKHMISAYICSYPIELLRVLYDLNKKGSISCGYDEE